MFYYTGMRLSELIALRVDDIDFSLNQVKVLGKRSKERIIPLLTIHLQDLRQYLDVREAHFSTSKKYLFLTASGNVLYPKLVYRCLLYTSPSPRDGLLSRMPSSA